MDAGHGNHWECLGESVEDLLPKLISVVCSTGDVDATIARTGKWDESGELCERTLASLIHSKGPLGVLAVLLLDDAKGGANLLTAYPLAIGAPPRRLKITEVPPPDEQLEGVITGEIGDAKVSFFDTKYFQNLDCYKVGDEYDFHLAGFIYTARCTNEETVQMTNEESIIAMHRAQGEEAPRLPDGRLEPITIHIAGATGLAPVSDKYRDDAEFYCVIDAVEEIAIEDIRMFRITPRIDPNEEHIVIPGLIFASPSKFEGGYVPIPGDSIGGGLWLQGYLDTTSGDAKENPQPK